MKKRLILDKVCLLGLKEYFLPHASLCFVWIGVILDFEVD